MENSMSEAPPSPEEERIVERVLPALKGFPKFASLGDETLRTAILGMLTQLHTQSKPPEGGQAA
jgi:hypothetical protein